MCINVLKDCVFSITELGCIKKRAFDLAMKEEQINLRIFYTNLIEVLNIEQTRLINEGKDNTFERQTDL